MPYCGFCGELLPLEARFCPSCGRPVAELTTLQWLLQMVEPGFSVEDVLTRKDGFIFTVNPKTEVQRDFETVRNELAKEGYLPYLQRIGKKLRLFITRQPPVKPSSWTWNLILLLATICTTIYVGYQRSLPLFKLGLMMNPWKGAVAFSAAIIGILGCHEMGHYLVAKMRGVKATPPYFIPFPSVIGTMGAVIQTKTTPSSRDALFDIGAAGPIAGLLMLIPVTILGLQWSYQIPLSKIPPGTTSLSIPILFRFINDVAGPHIHGGTTILLHPVGFAAWVGMLVTMLNLMPAGPLDGGHIARALLGPRWHRLVSFMAAGATLVLGWWFMAIFMFIFSLQPHPNPLNDVSQLSSKKKMLSISLFVLLVLCASPGQTI